MQIVMNIIGGPRVGKRIIIPAQEQITIGRVELADYAFLEDQTMSNLHFAITWRREECLLQDLNSSNGTFLNWKNVAEAVLRDGDLIRAGQSYFSVQFDDQDEISSDSELDERPTQLRDSDISVMSKSHHIKEESPNGSTVLPTVIAGVAVKATFIPTELTEEHGFVNRPVNEICADIEQLSDDARSAIQEGYTPAQFVEVIKNKKLLEDAILFLSHALRKRHAVCWACQCVSQEGENELDKNDVASLQIAREWVTNPNELNRRAAEEAAKESKYRTPASWAAMGAFWSEGNVAQSGLPEIVSATACTAHAVWGAVTLAAIPKDPEKALEKFQQFIELGLVIGRGE